MSTKSTCAPQYKPQLAEATKVIGVVHSQSPGPSPKATQARCRADVALFRHPGHDCIYQEARQCKKKLKDHARTIDGQMDAYRRKFFPSHFGLGETCVVARRNSAATRRVNELWWNEIRKGSVRDQLSFDYVRWIMGNGIKVHFVDGGHKWKRREHEWFKDYGHGR